MDNNLFTIGILIADVDEYVYIEKLFGDKAIRSDINNLVSHVIKVKAKDKEICLRTVLTGIGKVNAAMGTALIAQYCDMLINTGLSGGFSGTQKYDIVLGTQFVEHDVDLSWIGYKKGFKPGQTELLKSSEELNKDILRKFPFVKPGLFATGDSFISSDEQHDLIIENFNPIACDMESAAIASVADFFDIPFVSIRMVSDGADDSSEQDYRETLNNYEENGWLRLTFDWIKSL